MTSTKSYTTSKRLAAILAAVLVLCMTALTAFADTTVDFDTPGTYTLEIAGGNNSSPGRVDASGTAVEGYTYTVTFTGTAFYDAGVGAIQISDDNGTTWTAVAEITGSVINASGSGTISYTATDDVSIRVQSPRIGLYDAYTVTVVVAEPQPLAGPFAVVDSLSSGMWSVGTSLVSWVVANPLALIAVGLFILVAVIGGIRRLIPGV